MADKKHRILGIDPGTNVFGYGLIEISDDDANLIDLGVVRIQSIKDPYEKLREIYHAVQDLVERFDPNHLAIEAPFYGKNVQSMLKLGRAQGVTMAAAITMEVPITEYAPKKIKQSITGNGNATKEQVAAMLEQIFKTKINNTYLDATDALATALCHHYQRFSTTKSSNWAAYVKNNQNRIIG